MTTRILSLEATARTFGHELELVTEGIRLVRIGAAPRVVIAGLTMGERVLPRARVMAELSGLRVDTLPAEDSTTVDLEVTDEAFVHALRREPHQTRTAA